MHDATVIGRAGTVCVDVTLNWSKVKVTEHLNFRQLPITAHFWSISSATFAWSLKLMVGSDSMGAGLQLVRARFSNFLLGNRRADRDADSSNFPECRYFTKFKWPYFGTAWCYSQMVTHAGSTTGIVHADMTLTRSKVSVKVTGLLNFWKSAKSCMLVAMTVNPLAGLSGFY